MPCRLTPYILSVNKSRKCIKYTFFKNKFKTQLIGVSIQGQIHEVFIQELHMLKENRQCQTSSPRSVWAPEDG